MSYRPTDFIVDTLDSNVLYANQERQSWGKGAQGGGGTPNIWTCPTV